MYKYTFEYKVKKTLALIVAFPFVLALVALALYLSMWIVPVAVPAIMIGGLVKSYRRWKLTGGF